MAYEMKLDKSAELSDEGLDAVAGSGWRRKPEVNAPNWVILCSAYIDCHYTEKGGAHIHYIRGGVRWLPRISENYTAPVDSNV